MNRPPSPAFPLAMIIAAVLVASAAEAGSRVPVALAWDRDGRLVVALREGRSLIVVEPEGWRVAAEFPLEVRPATLAVADDGALLVGGQDGETLVVRSGEVVYRDRLGRGPTRVVALPGGRLATASVWERAVRVVDRATGRVVAEHCLPIEPGELLALPDGRLLVADAFNGRLASFQPGKIGSEQFWNLEGVNIRGLTFSEGTGEVLFAALVSSGAGPLTRTNIDWGLALSAKLGAFRLALLDQPGTRLDTRRLTLDGSAHGAADPVALAVSPDESRIYLALRGAHQILLADRKLGGPANTYHRPLGDSMKLRTCEVGRNPSALVLDSSGRLLVTADAMSDTLSVVATDTLEPVATVPLGLPDLERSAVLRGEALFLDGRNAMDRWMSCSSCHTDGHTNSLSFDTLGDGSYGEPKSTPTLLGVGQTAPYAWTGRFRTLEAQIDQSMRTSLHGPVPTPAQLADLAAYLRSLPIPPPVRAADDPAALRGASVFRARRCDSCHVPPSYTSRPLRDPWPESESDGSRYSPPSLRNVARSAPYFHDGRAPDLDAALKIHHPGTDEPLTTEEREPLIAFLESL